MFTEFESKWTEFHQLCATNLNQILSNISKLEAQIDIYGTIVDGTDHRKKVEELKNETIQLITKTSLDVIHLAKIIDEALDLTVEQANRDFSKIESVQDLPIELVNKKRTEIQLSKDFKMLLMNTKLLRMQKKHYIG